jgi:hypothetical protein
MIPQEELDRALARWNARKLGHAVAPAGAGYSGPPPSIADDDAPIHEEPTRVAAAEYSSQVETPQAEVHSEVHLNDSDFEDHTHR